MVVGRKIVGIRWMTQDEMDREGWDNTTVLIELDDGTKLYPSQDDEGNGPGALFGVENGKTVSIYPREVE